MKWKKKRRAGKPCWTAGRSEELYACVCRVPLREVYWEGWEKKDWVDPLRPQWRACIYYGVRSVWVKRYTRAGNARRGAERFIGRLVKEAERRLAEAE